MKNRVNPKGTVIESRARGTLMGNRGIIHNKQKEIIKELASKRWITCVLNYKCVKRMVMSPHQYTELFFLDEATSFSAGHRPCSLCRFEDAKKFKTLWSKLFPNLVKYPISFHLIDQILHENRVGPSGEKKIYMNIVDALPNGTMVSLNQNNDIFYLIYDKKLLLWSEDGYVEVLVVKKDIPVYVLTPNLIVEIFKQGYVPTLHETAYKLLKYNNI
jgi:hypothetical protein